MIYFRNPDEEMRRQEREATDPVSYARVLASKLRIHQISELQIRLAAVLGHPAALILFPEHEPPVFDHKGQVMWCGGARVAGQAFQREIEELPFDEMAQIQFVVIDTLLTILQEKYQDLNDPYRMIIGRNFLEARMVLREAVKDLIKITAELEITSSRYMVPDNEASCDNCAQVSEIAVIDVSDGIPTVGCSSCAPEVLVDNNLEHLRNRSAYMMQFTRTHEETSSSSYHGLRIIAGCYNAIQSFFEVLHHQIVLDSTLAEQHRSRLGVTFILVETCRLYSNYELSDDGNNEFRDIMFAIASNILRMMDEVE
jgi:hypothetical protein